MLKTMLHKRTMPRTRLTSSGAVFGGEMDNSDKASLEEMV
jgi:hypothetical protein